MPCILGCVYWAKTNTFIEDYFSDSFKQRFPTSYLKYSEWASIWMCRKNFTEEVRNSHKMASFEQATLQPYAWVIFSTNSMKKIKNKILTTWDNDNSWYYSKAFTFCQMVCNQQRFLPHVAQTNPSLLLTSEQYATFCPIHSLPNDCSQVFNNLLAFSVFASHIMSQGCGGD